jgi:hypothetical protein
MLRLYDDESAAAAAAAAAVAAAAAAASSLYFLLVLNINFQVAMQVRRISIASNIDVDSRRQYL